MVSEGCQHCDKPIASVRQGEHAEVIEDVRPVRDGGEQPIEVLLIDALGEEGNDFEQPSGIRAKFLEHRRGE